MFSWLKHPKPTRTASGEVHCGTEIEAAHDLHLPGIGRHGAALRTPDELHSTLVAARNHAAMSRYLLKKFEHGV